MLYEAPLLLVTGDTGSLGPVIVRGLRDAGCRVRALRRAAARPTCAEVDEVLLGNVNDVTTVRQAVDGVAAIVHMAAMLHVNDPAPSLREEYWRVNVEGTRLLAEAAAQAGVGRFVYLSTICVYGESEPGEIFDEQSPTRCETWYAETKREGERVVLATLPAVVLRLAAVYGPQMKGNYVRLAQALKRNRFLYVGSGLNRRTLVFDEDVAGAIKLSLAQPTALGKTYNVTDGAIHTFREIVEAICLASGRRPPRWHIPVGLVRCMAGAAEDAARCVRRRSPLTRQLVDKVVEDVAVSSKLIQRELGYRAAIDLAEGWCRVLAAGPARTT